MAVLNPPQEMPAMWQQAIFNAVKSNPTAALSILQQILDLLKNDPQLQAFIIQLLESLIFKPPTP